MLINRFSETLKIASRAVGIIGLNEINDLSLIHPKELEKAHVPPFSSSQHVMIVPVTSEDEVKWVCNALKYVYPAAHRVTLVSDSGNLQVSHLRLSDLDSLECKNTVCSLYLPPLGADTSFEAFQEIVGHLRAPADGCPWDLKQTHGSLRSNLIEETYETLEALDANDVQSMKEEFGDLLLQIVLHAQIGSEAGEFNMADILRNINQKIVRRHPHVFGDVTVDGEAGVLKNWEKIKADERRENGKETVKGLLDGVPQSLPALIQAQSYQDRAARVGFDWSDIQPVIDKVHEELNEVFTATTPEEREKELGDLLFAVVNLIRWHHGDAENALRQTNLKFRKRFSYIESVSRKNGRSMNEMTLQEMDVLWEEAKHLDE